MGNKKPTRYGRCAVWELSPTPSHVDYITVLEGNWMVAENFEYCDENCKDENCYECKLTSRPKTSYSSCVTFFFSRHAVALFVLLQTIL